MISPGICGFLAASMICMPTVNGANWEGAFLHSEAEAFQSIESIRYRASDNTRILSGPQAGKGILRTIEIVARKDKWKNAFHQTNGMEGTELRLTLCFDGARSFIFKNNNHLSITSKSLAGDVGLFLVDPLHLMYFFLASTDRAEDEDAYFVPKLAHFRNSAVWRTTRQRAIPDGEETIAGDRCFRARFVLSRPFLDRKDCVIVWFSPNKGGIPIRWECFIGEKPAERFGYRYELEEVGELPVAGGVFRFPRTAKLRQFTVPGSPDPSSVSDIRMEDVAVNDVNADDAFFIDPALARTIYDADTNVSIPAPR